MSHVRPPKRRGLRLGAIEIGGMAGGGVALGLLAAFLLSPAAAPDSVTPAPEERRNGPVIVQPAGVRVIDGDTFD